MSKYYQPTSDFLVMVANGEVPLTGSEFADANLRRLLAYTRDSDVSNRDWATFLLAHADVDGVEVTGTLHRCLEDESQVVQEEAMVGLARRHDLTALPQLHDWLRQGALSRMILEAAAEFGDPVLCQSLKNVEEWAAELKLHLHWAEACDRCGCGRTSA